MVAGSLGTIPGCVAVGLVDGRDHRVLAAWSAARVDLELAVEVFEQLLADSVPSAVRLLAPAEGPPRDVVVITGNHIHLFDRIDPETCVVAVCRATNLLATMTAFRESRSLLARVV